MSNPEHYFEVSSELKDNPYIAQVVCDPADQDAIKGEYYYSGHFAIQPPVAVSQDLLESATDNVGVKINPKITTQYASLFGFEVPDHGSFSTMPTRERIETTVRMILDAAGRADYVNLLKEMYKVGN